MKKYFLLFIFLIMVSNADASRFVGVCLLNAPNGHEQKTDKTKALFNRIGVEDTRSPEALTLYVEWFPKEGESPEGYYYHSNYVREGTVYPVKVVADVSSVRQVIENILYNTRDEADQNENLTNQVLSKSTLYLNENVFSSPRLIELGGADSIYIVNKKGQIRRVKRKKKEKSCVIELENPCHEEINRPLSYMYCRSELGELDLDSIAEGLIRALGSGFDCKVAKDF